MKYTRFYVTVFFLDTQFLDDDNLVGVERLLVTCEDDLWIYDTEPKCRPSLVTCNGTRLGLVLVTSSTSEKGGTVTILRIILSIRGLAKNGPF